MENEIILEFNKSITRLAGNPYGRTIYNEQVSKKIDFEEKNVIIFPDNIEKVASSFTQGLFSEIIRKIGYDKVKDVISIKARNRELEKNIYDDLYY